MVKRSIRGCKQQAGGGWSGNLKVIDQDEMNEQKHITQVYLRDSPSDQMWPQVVGGRFHVLLAEGELNQPGLKASELSRRQLRKDRLKKQQVSEEAEEKKWKTQ